MPYLLCESSHEVGWVLWSIFILLLSRAGLCFSLYLERECVRIYQRRRARSTLKNGFAWFRPNRTSWSGFFVPGTIFGSIRFIWAKTQPSRPFHSKDMCPFGPYVLPFPILFYSIRDSTLSENPIFVREIFSVRSSNKWLRGSPPPLLARAGRRSNSLLINGGNCKLLNCNISF